MSWYRSTQQTLAKLKERRTATLAHAAPSEATPTTIYRYAFGFFRHAAMMAALQLDLFTPLNDGPLSAEELGRELSIEPGRLQRLLNALVIAELLTIDGERYANTPETSVFLVRTSPSYLDGAQDMWLDLWRSALKTADTLRTGRPQAAHDFNTMTDDELDTFLRGMHPSAISAGHALARVLGLESRHSLLEVGGGSGGLSIAACQTCPDLQATVVELPGVASHTEAFVRRSGLSDRIKVLAVDLVDQTIEGSYEVAILRNVLQTLDPGSARRVVDHVAAALPSGGSIHVLGWLLNDDGLKPSQAVLHDLLYLNLFEHGAAHRISEVRLWLERSGFEDIVGSDPPAAVGGAGFAMLSGKRRARSGPRAWAS